MNTPLSGIDIARYFLLKDPTRKVFNKSGIEHRENRIFYAGNTRLNEYLHLAQNLWIAKTGQKLFFDDLYAFDNGAIVYPVMNKYSLILEQNIKPELPDNVISFLDKFYVAFQNASLDELIELSHEDNEWQIKHQGQKIPDQRMDSLAHMEEYKQQYAGILEVLERMP